MRPARGLVRLVPPLAIALVGIVGGLAGERAALASPPASDGTSHVSSGPDGASADAGGATKKADKPGSKKTSRKSKASPDRKVTHKKATHPARTKLAHVPGGTINENVTLTPFPSHAGAAKKALAQNRRDQLDDAEKAARGPDQAERWQTVLFHLRDLDARGDSEGCFWRLISYYRLGQVERARALRQGCELAAKDAGIIEAEDERAAGLQPSGALADQAPASAGNLAPYAGDGPVRAER